MFDIEQSNKCVTNRILLKLRANLNEKTDPVKLNFYPEDFKQCRLTENDFYDILLDFKNKGYIEEICGTNYDDEGEEIAGKWVPYSQFPSMGLEGAMPGIFIITVYKNFEKKCKRENNEFKKVKIDLKSAKITFNDEEAVIKIGNQKCQLPPFKNEHYFCRAMFQFPIKEFVDWSTIYEKYEGMESKNKMPSNPKKDKRTIQDAMYAINKRIKEVISTGDNLFTWKEKSIKRNY